MTFNPGMVFIPKEMEATESYRLQFVGTVTDSGFIPCSRSIGFMPMFPIDKNDLEAIFGFTRQEVTLTEETCEALKNHELGKRLSVSYKKLAAMEKTPSKFFWEIIAIKKDIALMEKGVFTKEY